MRNFQARAMTQRSKRFNVSGGSRRPKERERHLLDEQMESTIDDSGDTSEPEWAIYDD